VSEYGPAGIPDDAVLSFLKKAFELVTIGDKEIIVDKDDPMVDLLLKHGGEVSLVLTLSMCGIWKPKFTFPLLPVGLDKIDVLEAKLRDAQEEIEIMKREKEDVGFLSVSSKTCCAAQGFVVWDAIEPKVINSNYFRMNTENREVTILQRGAYMIQVRLAGNNNGNGGSLGLQINGTDIARCMQSDANNHQNTPQIYEVVLLNVNDVLRVRWGGNQNSLADPLANRLTIIRLGK